MKAKRLASGILLLFATHLTHADKRSLAEAPPAFAAECGSCHVAFPPQLLPADDWRRVMRSLDKHYGDNASLGEKTRALLEDFLVRHGGSPGRLGAGGTARPSEPPRLTQTAWFLRKHREVSRRDWQAAKTPANCAACHRQADAGSYREREIVMPDGRRGED